MKKKAMLAVLVLLSCVIGLTVLSNGKAEAAAANYTCTISEAGCGRNGYYVVTLSDTTVPIPAFTNVSFYLSSTNFHEKEMYATALTAFANNTYLYVNLSAITAGSIVNQINAKK